jgi:ribulose 1,5-bisphosphate synthetase/thiazole synthase
MKPASVLRILGFVVACQATARAETHVSPVQDLTADAVFQSTGKGAMR